MGLKNALTSLLPSKKDSPATALPASFFLTWKTSQKPLEFYHHRPPLYI
jgi:hypothetical protein